MRWYSRNLLQCTTFVFLLILPHPLSRELPPGGSLYVALFFFGRKWGGREPHQEKRSLTNRHRRAPKYYKGEAELAPGECRLAKPNFRKFPNDIRAEPDYSTIGIGPSRTPVPTEICDRYFLLLKSFLKGSGGTFFKKSSPGSILFYLNRFLFLRERNRQRRWPCSRKRCLCLREACPEN